MTGHLPRTPSGRGGFTLLEVLIAIAILGMVAASLLAMRLDAVRTERLQRQHAELTQLIRSEAETLRDGASGAGECSSITDAHRAAGFRCEVELRCGFSGDVCNALVGGLQAYVIRAIPPGGTALEVPVVFRSEATRAIAAQR